MKYHCIKAIAATGIYLAVFLILDAIFGEFHTVKEYAIQSVVFGVIFGFFLYLEGKGVCNKKDHTEQN